MKSERQIVRWCFGSYGFVGLQSLWMFTIYGRPSGSQIVLRIRRGNRRRTRLTNISDQLFKAIHSVNYSPNILFESTTLATIKSGLASTAALQVPADNDTPGRFPIVSAGVHMSLTLQNPHLGLAPSHRDFRCLQTYHIKTSPVHQQPHKQLLPFS
jgi:hypothetical protein